MKPTKGTTRDVRYIGLDLGDRVSHYAVKDAEGHLLEEGRTETKAGALEKTFRPMKGDRLLMEVGTHSPWVQRALKKIGIDVRVCDARSAAEANRYGHKTDVRDARMLAELLRTDSQLVTTVEHRSEMDQRMWTMIRARDALVRARTMLVNLVRGVVKSTGSRLKGCSTEAFNQTWGEIAPEMRPPLSPIYVQIRQLTAAIRRYEKKIESFVKKDRPQAQQLTQITGVGDITALACVLTLGNVKRFRRSRDAAAYLGLVPQKRESGDIDPQLGITKRGNATVRRLLVNAAHYIIGPFNKTESDLRTFGLRLAGGGNDKRRKKRAVVAVARKLAVVMTALLKSGEAYEAVRGRTKDLPALSAS
jgi:transposase